MKPPAVDEGPVARLRRRLGADPPAWLAELAQRADSGKLRDLFRALDRQIAFQEWPWPTTRSPCDGCGGRNRARAMSDCADCLRGRRAELERLAAAPAPPAGGASQLNGETA